MTQLQAIKLGVILYCLMFYLLPYIISVVAYKQELKARKNGPPRAYYPPLHKPRLFKLKTKYNGNKNCLPK